MKKYISHSEKETKDIAQNIAKESKSNTFALTGELGAGKTIFVQGFAKALGIEEKIISPTFVLIRQHQIPHTQNALYHIDLYRLEDAENIKHLGLEDLWSDSNNIILIEWAEKYPNLPDNTVKISITKLDENARQITVSSQTDL
ncbi:tRNA (adenosine(37)-N6)-threonylcarbamoyltransferase complex ATPase subunit type 1 TsaE [Candidatus Daviesbacteria bacterium]|nr:tRNA (adenosine(37)-N6)-threonylcarbamoyltransferase complex ATPase subunit type 1 TsaE [Candidatus Daviesbacteria bacterium]